MKNRLSNIRNVSTILILVLILILATACGGDDEEETPEPTNTPQPPAAQVDPTATSAPQAPAATTFDTTTLALVSGADGQSMEVWVYQVENLAGLDLRVEFDASKMQVTDANTDKDGIQLAPGEAPSPDFEAENLVDNEAGILQYAVVSVLPSEPFNGDGVVATITYEGEFSASDIQVMMSSPEGERIEADVQ